MSRQKKGYGFTTKPDDPYLLRVAREAKPHQKFILTQAKNTQTGEQKVVVLVRRAALTEKPILVMGKPVTNVTPSRGGRVPGFLTLSFPTSDLERTTNRARNDLQILKNVVANRVLRVAVEVV